MTGRSALHAVPVSGLAGRTGSSPAATAGVHVLLFALGLLLGLLGALLVPRGPRLGGTLISVGVLVAVVGNLAAPWLGRAAAGRLGGLTPAAGWLLAALALGTTRPAGSVVLPGGGDLAVPALAFLLLGSLTAAVAAAVGPPGRRR